MKVEQESVLLISDVLLRILFTLVSERTKKDIQKFVFKNIFLQLDQEPRNLDDLADKVRSTFPSTLAYFVMKVSRRPTSATIKQ